MFNNFTTLIRSHSRKVSDSSISIFNGGGAIKCLKNVTFKAFVVKGVDLDRFFSAIYSFILLVGSSIMLSYILLSIIFLDSALVLPLLFKNVMKPFSDLLLLDSLYSSHSSLKISAHLF